MNKLLIVVLALGVMTIFSAIAVQAQVSHTASEITAGTIDGTLYIGGGKVGIGTTNLDNKLEVNGAIEIQVNDADNKLRFHDSGDYWYSMGIDRSDAGKFKINSGGTIGDNAHFTMTTGGNVGIGTASPGVKLDVRGDNYRLSNTGVVKEFDVAFPHDVPNQKVDFYMTGTQQFWGTIEITVTSSYNHQNSAGLIKKVYGLGLNPGGTIYANDARYTEVLGVTADNWALSDFSWDGTNSRYKITLVHRTSTGNTPRISIKAFGQTATQASYAATFTMGGIYTTDATVYGRPYEHFNNNVGIGTASPDARLHVIGAVCAEASDSGCAPTSGDIRGTRLCIGTDCRNAWPTSGTGTVTSVGSGSGLTGGPITTSGTLNVGAGTCITVGANSVGVTGTGCKDNWDAAYIHSTTDADTDATNEIQTLGTSGNTITLTSGRSVTAPYATNADTLDGHDTSYFQTALTNPVTGTGTANYIPKFTGASTIGNSVIYDNGNVGIGTTEPGAKLDVRGSGYGVYGSGSTAGVYGSGTSSGVKGVGSIGVYGYGTGSGTTYGVKGIDVTTNSIGILGYGRYGGHMTGDLYVSGDVGIGIASPGAKLHVKSGGPTEIKVTGAGQGYANAAIVLEATDDINARATGIYMHDAGGKNEWFAGRRYGGGGNDKYSIFRQTSQQFHNDSTAGTYHSDATELFVIDSSGVISSIDGSYGIYSRGTSYGVRTYGAYGAWAYGNWGFYDFYAAGVGTNYGPFTGGHETKISSDIKNKNLKQGMIVSSTGETQFRVDENGTISLSSTLPTIKISDSINDKAVLGVFVYETPLHVEHWYCNKSKKGDKFAVVNALGEGRVLVTNFNGEIEVGDYITTSEIAGYGMKQDDDLVHSYTLGKATEDIDWDNVEEIVKWNGQEYKVYLTAVVYTSG